MTLWYLWKNTREEASEVSRRYVWLTLIVEGKWGGATFLSSVKLYNFH